MLPHVLAREEEVMIMLPVLLLFALAASDVSFADKGLIGKLFRFSFIIDIAEVERISSATCKSFSNWLTFFSARSLGLFVGSLIPLLKS